MKGYTHITPTLKRKTKHAGEVTQPPRVRHAESRAPGWRVRWYTGQECAGRGWVQTKHSQWKERCLGSLRNESLQASEPVGLSISHAWW